MDHVLDLARLHVSIPVAGQIQQLSVVFASAYVFAELIDIFKGPASAPAILAGNLSNTTVAMYSTLLCINVHCSLTRGCGGNGQKGDNGLPE
jgi:hypothetical protein